ncbi:MAG: N-acetylmuramate alpha-1-phosphate uridylyltransferase MurU [Gammaproteobacteria bacterium]
MSECAMILAAGRGERLRPHTDSCPKPLLEVNARPLIFYHLESLALAGVSKVVVNLSWLGEQIEAAVGDGRQFGLRVIYSCEPEPLDAAGGIVQALDLLDDRFVVVNADIYTNYRFENLTSIDSKAHLVLVNNPDHNLQGDFALNHGRLSNAFSPRLTFSGIAIYQKCFFEDCTPGKRALAPLLRAAADEGIVSGEIFEGNWVDVGTVERWQSI